MNEPSPVYWKCRRCGWTNLGHIGWCDGCIFIAVILIASIVGLSILVSQ